MVDAAGNYVFELNSETYRVMKMNVFQQRDFFGIIKEAFVADELGNNQLDLYSQGCNEAQDWLLARIYHKETDDKYAPLSGDYLDVYLNTMEERHDVKAISGINSLFVKAVEALLENFTGTGKELTPTNSSQSAEENLEVTSTPNLLSKTLSK